MAGLVKKPSQQWITDTKVQYVRFDNPKLQSCGCFFGRVQPTLSTLRSPSCRRQDDDSMARAHDNARKNSPGNLCKRDNTDWGHEHLDKEECMNMAEAQPNGELRHRKCTEWVAEDLRHEEECVVIAGAHRHEKKYIYGDRCNNEDTDSLGGYFFRKEECINLDKEESSQSSKNRNPLAWSPFSILRKAWTDAGGNAESISHSASRSHTNSCAANADHPPRNSHSRSLSQSSSRCATPRSLRRNHARTFSSPQESLRSSASRSGDPGPENGFSSMARERTKSLHDYPPSRSKPPQSRAPVSCAKAALPQMSSFGIRVPVPRRTTLIERYQKGLFPRKSSGSRIKASSYGRRKSSLPTSNGKKDPVHFFKCYERSSHDKSRGKSDEGLSPLRSPWQKVPKTTPYEDPVSLRCEQLSPNNQQRSNHHPPEYYDAKRESSNYRASSHSLQESFEYEDPSHGNSHRPQAVRQSSNYSNTPYTTRGSCDSDSPQISRRSSQSTDPPHPWDLSSPYDNPHTTRESFPYRNPPTTKDSYRCGRPPLHSAKQLSSTNEYPHTARDSGWQNDCLAPTKLLPPSEKPHDARNSSRRNDLCGAREVDHLYSVRDVFDDPHKTQDSWWYNDSGSADEASEATKDSWWHNDPVDGGREVSSSFDASHRDSWRHTSPDRAREAASPFDGPHRDSRRHTDPYYAARQEATPFEDPHTARASWRHTDAHAARQAASPSDHPHTARDSWQHNDPDAARELSSDDDFDPHARRATLPHDNTPPIRLPCRPSQQQQYDLSPPLSPGRCYGQPQSHKPFQTQNSRNRYDDCSRVAAHHPTSTGHIETDHSLSFCRSREKDGN